MFILGLESSCDDTSVALLEEKNKRLKIKSQKTANQYEIHRLYGGVVPEIAARRHAEAVFPLIEEILGHHRPSLIAATVGPGLITGLAVGVVAAKALGSLLKVPVIGVNHLAGHMASACFQENDEIIPFENYPILSLVVSGGHTSLFLKSSARAKLKKLGSTRDDAAGECFDKVGKLLGLPYPGGPAIAHLAAKGVPTAAKGESNAIVLPRPMIKEDNFDFSFAGLKTAALYWLRDHEALDEKGRADFCAGLQAAIVETLVEKTARAAQKYRARTIAIGGGVSANVFLREKMKLEIEKRCPRAELFFPPIRYAMDNAAMIAYAGFEIWKKNDFKIKRGILRADPNLPVD